MENKMLNIAGTNFRKISFFLSEILLIFILFSNILLSNQKSELTAKINAVSFDDNDVEIATKELNIESKVSQKVKPLLNYIFFDENSSEIAKRYIKLSIEEKNNFGFAQFYNYTNLAVYHQILNIVGYRMKQNSKSKIQLTGCKNDKEKGGQKLSHDRAKNIKNYLMVVWGIAENRIQTNGRNLPENASSAVQLANDPFIKEKLAEDRRVEISDINEDHPVLLPVETTDTISISKPSFIRFNLEVPEIDDLVYWEFKVNKLKYSEDKKFTTKKLEIPKFIDWNVENHNSSIPKESQNVKYSLTFKDKSGNVFKSEDAFISVNAELNPKPFYIIDGNKQISIYNLIFFEFSKNEIAKKDLITIGFIKDKIKDSSNVFISGYSDRVGDITNNIKLSEERAKSVAKLLQISNTEFISGNGYEPLYNNNLPEGRFYNRTVIVKIENQLDGTE